MAEKILVLNGSKGVRRFELPGVGKVMLAPGANLLEKKVVDALIETHPAEMAAWGITNSAPVKKAKGEPTLKDLDITTLNSKDAVSTIKATNDLEALKVWKAQEEGKDSRKTVIVALERQVEIVGITLESEAEG